MKKERWDRLIMHLEKVEELTGEKLRETGRNSKDSCPIMSLSPDHDSNGGKYRYTRSNGGVFYRTPSCTYEIFDSEDGQWWKDLSQRTRYRVTKKVMAWIKNKKEEE